MAGAGLVAIKTRMKSVTNTRKITKAMGLVATAKLRKARTALSKSQEYNKNYTAIFEEILNNFHGKSIYTENNGSDKKLYVVFTSETGLCGGFNAAVVNKTVEMIKGKREESLVLVVGQKGRSHFKRLRYETTAEYVEVPDIPTTKEAAVISQHIIDLFKKGEVGEVFAIYTEFQTSVKQEQVVQKLLPLDINVDYGYKDYLTFEPGIDEFFDCAVEKNILQKLYYYLANSKTSEHSARMTAMDGATKNANDLLEKLALKYNRIRQSSITQEISEIVGGAEAQK